MVSENQVHAKPCDASGWLKPEQVSQWKAEGYTLVSGLLDDQLISTLQNAALEKYPAPDSEAAAKIADFGSSGELLFPRRSRH